MDLSRFHLPAWLDRPLTALVAWVGGPDWWIPLRIRIFMQVCEIVGVVLVVLPVYLAFTIHFMTGHLDYLYWGFGYLGGLFFYNIFLLGAPSLRVSLLNVYLPLGFHLLKRFITVRG